MRNPVGLCRNPLPTLGSLNQKLVTQRLETAQRLLMETDLPLPDIAERSGFQHAEYMAYVFRRQAGISPARHRTRTRH